MERVAFSSSKLVTIAAGLLCAGGLMSYFRADENAKPLALNIALTCGAIATTTQLLTTNHEQLANEQLGELVEKLSKPLKQLEADSKQKDSVIAEIRRIHRENEVQLEKASTELGVAKDAIALLKIQIASKTKELEAKLSERDTRVDDFLTKFKHQLAEDLSDRVHRVYNKLAETVKSKIGSDDYQTIHGQLQNFSDSLDNLYQSHCDLLLEIPDLEGDDIITLSINIYSQICDEISALRVRFRNLLNIHERMELNNAFEILGNISRTHTPITKAQQLINQYSDYQRQQLENIYGKSLENDQSLEELKNQVQDLLNQIESKNLLIAELKKPLRWTPATRDDLRVGNVIITYFESLGIILDRASSDYQKWDAILSFHIDRNSRVILPKELNEHSEKLQQLTHTLAPINFKWDSETGMITAYLLLSKKPQKTVDDEVINDVLQFIQPPESLIEFVKNAYHVGMWAETGGGKSTAISNVIGGMIEELGGVPTIRTTIPKLDADTAKIFPHVDWLGVPNSIFGLLEAALEIQYRIHINEQAFLKGEEIGEFDPILFFIDEINLIFTRWKSINEADLEDVLERFADTLSGEKLEYFNQFMRIELGNYKQQFAKKLLLFIWQTGRSLRVKSLIAGQNLQPGSFGMMVNDLANCAYISFGDSIRSCQKYKVRDIDADLVSKNSNLLQKALKTNPQLKYTALYCPTQGEAFFGTLPPPNHYQWDKDLVRPEMSKTVQNPVQNASNGAFNWTEDSKAVQLRPTLDTPQGKGLDVFKDASNLPKKFQNLSFEAYVQLWTQLPKKPDGSVHKTLAYEKVFGVSRSSDRKVVSDLIDWLERNLS
ncbi:MAG: hypothetical protein NHB32_31925 [Fischerella sp. CENA71]|nr:hypothetical protein [Fischerella sp. CENA71]